jgi:nitrogen fixation protein
MVIKVNYTISQPIIKVTDTSSNIVVKVIPPAPIYINVNGGSGGISNAIWGSITGTLSNQTDLQNALNGKYNNPTGTTAQYIRGDGSLATLPSTSGFVPYTGATTNVNLGEYDISAGQFTLDVSPTGTAVVGTTRWNNTLGSSETTLKGGSVILKNGVDLVARVVNKVSPNATLTKANYTAVRVSGAQGQRLAVAYAQANNDNNSADTLGLVIETIATNQEGFIMTVGQIEEINTTGSLQGETWADGDVLYLSPFVAGALTNVKPTNGVGHIVVIGYVEYAHSQHGKIYVKIMNGWEIGELHDVAALNPDDGDVLQYVSSTGLWTKTSSINFGTW